MPMKHVLLIPTVTDRLFTLGSLKCKSITSALPCQFSCKHLAVCVLHNLTFLQHLHAANRNLNAKLVANTASHFKTIVDPDKIVCQALHCTHWHYLPTQGKSCQIDQYRNCLVVEDFDKGTQIKRLAGVLCSKWSVDLYLTPNFGNALEGHFFVGEGKRFSHPVAASDISLILWKSVHFGGFTSISPRVTLLEWAITYKQKEQFQLPKESL